MAPGPVVGIEVEPTTFDVGIVPGDMVWHVTRDAGGIDLLVEHLRDLQPVSILLSEDAADLQFALARAGLDKVDRYRPIVRALRRYAGVTDGRRGLLIARYAEAQMGPQFCWEDGAPLQSVGEYPFDHEAWIGIFWCVFCRTGRAILRLADGRAQLLATMGSAPDPNRPTVVEAEESLVPAIEIQRILDAVEPSRWRG